MAVAEANWRAEEEQRLATAKARWEAGEEQRLAAARAKWKAEDEQRLNAVEVKWRQAEDQRLAAAEAKWRENVEFAAAEPASGGFRDGARPDLRLRDSTKRRDPATETRRKAEEARRMAAAEAKWRTAEEHRLAAAKAKWQVESSEALAVAERKWRQAEEERLAAAEANWRAGESQRIAAATARIEAGEEQRLAASRARWKAEEERRVADVVKEWKRRGRQIHLMYALGMVIVCGLLIVVRPDPGAWLGTAKSSTKDIVERIEETIPQAQDGTPDRPKPASGEPTEVRRDAGEKARPADTGRPAPSSNSQPDKRAAARTMYVAVEVANVRIDPSPSGQIIGTLGRDTAIEVLKSAGDWLNVQIPGVPGAAGWMHKSELSSRRTDGS